VNLSSGLLLRLMLTRLNNWNLVWICPIPI